MSMFLLMRVAKVIALLGFLLPWAAISCSGQEIASMSGLDIVRGHLEVNNQNQSFDPNWMLVGALLATLAGFGLTFMAGDDKTRGRNVLIAAGVAVVLTFVGMMLFKDTPRREAARAQAGETSSYESQLGAASLSMIRVEERAGYFITLFALAGAAGLGFMTMTGRALQLPALPAMPAGAAGALGSVLRRPDDDVADWDRIANKDDADALQEYLLRHPNGRFAELARMKLERMGVKPVERAAAPPPAAPPPAPQAAPPPQAAAPQTAAPPPRVAPTAPPPSRETSPSERGFEPIDAPEKERRGMSPVLIAVIAVVVLAALGGGGFIYWRNIQAEQAAQATAEAWAQTSRDDPAAIRAFLAGEPGELRAEVEAALRELEQRRLSAAQELDTPEALQAFLNDFPESESALVVRGRIAELNNLTALSAPIVGTWSGFGVQVSDQGLPYEYRVRFWAEGQSLRGEWEVVGLCRGLWTAPEGVLQGGSPWAFTAGTGEASEGPCGIVNVMVAAQPDGALAVTDAADGAPIVTLLRTEWPTTTP